MAGSIGGIITTKTGCRPSYSNKVGKTVFVLTSLVFVFYVINDSRVQETLQTGVNDIINIKALTVRHTASVPICTSKQRLDYIRRKFRELGLRTKSDRLGLTMALERQRLAFCFVPKSASMTTRRVLFKIAANSYNRTVPYHSVKHVDIFLEQGIRLIRRHSVLKNTTQGYRKMVIVRNPIDRFVSAFNYLFLEKKPPDYQTNLDSWINEHMKNSSLPLFQQFVTAVLGGHRNGHWDPYAFDCHYESIDYDDVMRLETYRHDFEPLLNIYLAVDWDSVVGESKNVYRSNSSGSHQQKLVSPRHLSILKQISREERLALKEMYRYDLLLFGYDFDVDTLMASCRIETEDGHVCCWRHRIDTVGGHVCIQRI